MAKHIRLALLCALALLVGVAASAPLLAAVDADAFGNWRVEFVSLARGTVAVNMTINQSGTRLTGRVVDEYGEYPIDGRLADDQVTVTWTVPEDGKLLEITMKGTLAGDTITGTAKLGNVGEGALRAHRTSENDQ